MEALFKDKKFEAGAIRFVLTGSSAARLSRTEVSEEDIRMAIDQIRELRRSGV